MNSEYCEDKYHHIEEIEDEYNVQDKYDCYEEYGIPNTELDCPAIRNTPRGTNFEIA